MGVLVRRWVDGFHSFGEEAVIQSVYVGANVLVPLSRGKRRKQSVSRVGGVSSYTTSPCLNPAVASWVQVWERTPHNLLHSPFCYVQDSFHTITLQSDKGYFLCRFVKVCQKLRGESSPFVLPEKEKSVLGLLQQVGYLCGPSEIRWKVYV